MSLVRDVADRMAFWDKRVDYMASKISNATTKLEHRKYYFLIVFYFEKLKHTEKLKRTSATYTHIPMT